MNSLNLIALFLLLFNFLFNVFSSEFLTKTKFLFISAASDYQGNMAQRTDHQMLEEENDRMVDHLSSKVQALKSVSCNKPMYILVVRMCLEQ